MTTPLRKSNFVQVNGINLHYLDWGGIGPVLIFLTGLGSSARVFSGIAPRFAGKFRVLALTRRGQGESDIPAAGYELDALVDDVIRFMDVLQMEKAVFAGHSFAGVEMTRLADRHPEKVLGLIYLDAVYDPQGMHKVLVDAPPIPASAPDVRTEFLSVDDYIAYTKRIRPDLAAIWNWVFDETSALDLDLAPDGKYIEKNNGFALQKMLDSVVQYDSSTAKITAPVLRIDAVFHPARPAYYSEDQIKALDEFHQNRYMPFKREMLRRFKEKIPQAEIIQVENSHHFCFISNEEEIFKMMDGFLNKNGIV